MKTSLAGKKMPAFAPVKNIVTSPTGTLQSMRLDPSYANPSMRGHSLGDGNAGEKYVYYLDPVFVDSTTTSSFSSVSMIDQHYLGVNLDPKSIIFDPVGFQPLLTSADSYWLDTVWVAGVYQRRGHTIDDTLIVSVAWGDTTMFSNSTSASTLPFARRAFAASAPQLAALGNFFQPRFSTDVAHGDVVRYTGAQSLRIKHVLTKDDSTYMDANTYFPIVVNQLIPADNIVNASFSFNAGQAHTNQAVSYAGSTAATPGEISGWAGLTWYQDDFTGDLAGLADGYDDFDAGKNGSTFMLKKARYKQYASTSLSNLSMYPHGYFWGYWIDFSIHADAATKVANLNKEGFALSQNVPNPYTGESKVNYSLTKNAKSAVFTVTDVMGRVISTENVDATSGLHTVKLGAYAAGVYYYSLNVDGNVTTKKMIVE